MPSAATRITLQFTPGTAELCGAVDQDLNVICVRSDADGSWHYFHGWTEHAFNTACDNWIRKFDRATQTVTYSPAAAGAA